MWEYILDHKYLIKKCLYWILGTVKTINFYHDICMKESPLIKLSQEWRSRSIVSIKVNYFTKNNKTWNTSELMKRVPHLL